MSRDDDDLLVLVPGDDGDPETGDGWRPELALQHNAKRKELYVIVCDEVEGMAEGVTGEMFELLRKRLAAAPEVE